jgi:hypothetical protein
MAQLDETFDSSTVEPSSRSTVPAGKYLCSIISSEIRDTSSGGKGINLEFVILEGEYANRHLWVMLNTVHSNPDTVKYAKADLSAICRAIGRVAVSDTEQLHNIPMMVTVRVKPAGNDKNGIWRDEQNNLGGYTAATQNRSATINRTATAQQPRGVPQARPATAQPTKTPPWQRVAAANKVTAEVEDEIPY